jgi:Protein of unknown function (DUF2628)
MHIYTVFLPSGTSSTPGAEEAVFVRQGFNRSAFLLTPLWALRHGYWLALALWFAWVFVVVLLASYGNLSLGAAFALYNLGAFAFGLEADRFGEAKASRKGFLFRGLTLGDSLGEAESLYFGRHLAALQPESYDARSASLSKSGGDRTNMTAVTDLLGLFPREPRK